MCFGYKFSIRKHSLENIEDTVKIIYGRLDYKKLIYRKFLNVTIFPL